MTVTMELVWFTKTAPRQITYPISNKTCLLRSAFVIKLLGGPSRSKKNEKNIIQFVRLSHYPFITYQAVHTETPSFLYPVILITSHNYKNI